MSLMSTVMEQSTVLKIQMVMVGRVVLLHMLTLAEQTVMILMQI